MCTSTIIKNLSIATAGAALIVLGTPLSAAAASLYAITDLGHLGGNGSYANAINNVGQVVGYSYTSNGSPQAFLWDKGTMTGLLGPGNAIDINDAGVAIGYQSIWIDGTLYPPLFFQCQYFSINNSALQMTGAVGLFPSQHAFMSYGGQKTDLGTLGGNMSVGTRINDAAVVVGFSSTSSGDTHAFIWRPLVPNFHYGIMTDLGTLGGSYSAANGINNGGQVVGSSSTSSGSTHAFLSNGGMTDLGTLGGNYSEAKSINDASQVVGYSYTTTGSNHAFLWENSRMTDLNNLLPVNSGWELYQATDINNKGQIVGNGRFNGQLRAFLLTPVSASESVPEPNSALGLLAFGCLGAATILHRKHQRQDRSTIPANQT